MHARAHCEAPKKERASASHRRALAHRRMCGEDGQTISARAVFIQSIDWMIWIGNADDGRDRG